MPATGLAGPERPQPGQAGPGSLEHVSSPPREPKPRDSTGPAWSSPRPVSLKLPPLLRSSCPRIYGRPKTRKKKSVPTAATSVHKTPTKPAPTLDLGDTGNRGVAHGNARKEAVRGGSSRGIKQTRTASRVPRPCGNRSRHVTDWPRGSFAVKETKSRSTKEGHLIKHEKKMNNEMKKILSRNTKYTTFTTCAALWPCFADWTQALASVLGDMGVQLCALQEGPRPRLPLPV